MPAILIPFPCRLFPCHFRQAGWIPKRVSGINGRGIEAQHPQKCPMAFLVLIPLPSAESRLNGAMKIIASSVVAPNSCWAWRSPSWVELQSLATLIFCQILPKGSRTFFTFSEITYENRYNRIHAVKAEREQRRGAENAERREFFLSPTASLNRVSEIAAFPLRLFAFSAPPRLSALVSSASFRFRMSLLTSSPTNVTPQTSPATVPPRAAC